MAERYDLGIVSSDTLKRRAAKLTKKKDSVRAEISSVKMTPDAAEELATFLRKNNYQVRLTIGCTGCSKHSKPIAHIFVVIKK